MKIRNPENVSQTKNFDWCGKILFSIFGCDLFFEYLEIEEKLVEISVIYVWRKTMRTVTLSVDCLIEEASLHKALQTVSSPNFFF